MKKILIIGLGRFGKLLVKILRDDFDVYVSSRSDRKDETIKLGVNWIDAKKGIETCDVIIYCVPISQFEQIFISHLEFFKNAGPKLIIDIQSVKVAPRKVLTKHLPKNCQAVLTHPLFGPDSVRQNGLTGLKIMMNQFRASDKNYIFWKKYFLSKQLQVIEMTAEEHDRQAALSQGVVFFVGRVLEDFGFSETEVDTFWAKQLQQIVHNAVTNDSWELFVDLQTKNHFTKKMRINLGKSLDKIYEKLLPEKVSSALITFGIQGGRGSFTHQAVLTYIEKNEIKNFDIKFLYTSQKVLDSLHRGEIDIGLMAIHNSVGGVVDETIQAMAQFKFKIIDELAILISHCLMKRKETKLNHVKLVMTHPQVLKQCRQTLKNKYSHLKFTSGSGDLIDHSAVAKNLAQGKIDPNIGVMGPEKLAEIYDLEIIDRDLQDSKNNLTSFILVRR